MTEPDALVTALRDAALAMTGRQSMRDLGHVLDMIVRSAVETVPGVDAGGVSITENRDVAARSSTHSAITTLDRLQSELNEGPCMSAIAEPGPDGVVVAHDLAGQSAARWPLFAPQAVEAGYRSILSIQLAAGPGTRAALNLYAAQPDVFDTEARQVAGLFGVQATVLLYGTEEAGHLQRAVDSRDVIGQAKGILMERFTVDPDAAFQMLVRSSQDTNMKLIDVATWLIGQVVVRAATTSDGARRGI